MASRGRITLQKRQREMARKEKQRLKAERRSQRKLARNTGETGTEEGKMPSASEAESESSGL